MTLTVALGMGMANLASFGFLVVNVTNKKI